MGKYLSLSLGSTLQKANIFNLHGFRGFGVGYSLFCLYSPVTKEILY